MKASAHAPRLGDQSGVTLVELMVSVMIGIVVIGGGVMIFNKIVSDQPDLAKRGSQIQTARTFMERVTHELRQGKAVDVTASSATQLRMQTYVNTTSTCTGVPGTTAQLCWVTYTCASGTCTRRISPTQTGTGTTTTAVTGLASNNVFSYLPSAATPGYVGLDLVLTATGAEDAISLSGGVDLRNSSV